MTLRILSNFKRSFFKKDFMKFKFASGFIILFMFMTNVSFGQDTSVEDQWMNCVYSAYEDEGEAIRNILAKFEALLIDEGVMKNGKGSSYKKLLEKMADGKMQGSESRSNIIRQLVEIEKEADNPAIYECQSGLKDHPDYAAVINSKDSMITGLITDDKLTMRAYAQGLIDAHEGRSFDSQYIKLLIMIAFDLDLITGG